MTTLSLLELLTWAQITLLIGAIWCLGLSLHLYSSYSSHKTNLRLLPIHALVAPMVALAGIGTSLKGPHIFLALTSLFLCTSLFFENPARRFVFHACACFFIAGGTYQVADFRHQLLNNILTAKPHSVYGVVVDKAPWKRTQKGCILTLSAQRINNHIGLEPLNSIIRCYLYSTPSCNIGEAVCARRIQLCSDKKSPAHLRAHQVRNGVVGSFFAPYLSYYSLRHTPTVFSWGAWCARKRSALLKSLQGSLPDDSFTYLGALFFGNKNSASFPRVRRLFNRWGITHYLARSGLHIALIIMLWSLFLGMLPLSLTSKTVLLGLLITCYSALSWASISFWRALWLWLFYTAAFFARRLPQPLYLLSALTLGIVLIHPANALCLDFQLSFFLTMTLMLIGFTRRLPFIFHR